MREVLAVEEHEIPQQVWEDLHAEMPRTPQHIYQRGAVMNAREFVACGTPPEVVQLMYRYGLRRGLIDPAAVCSRWMLDEASFRLAAGTWSCAQGRGVLAWMAMDGRIDAPEEVLAEIVSRRSRTLLLDAWGQWCASAGKGEGAFDHEGWRELAGGLEDLPPAVAEVVCGLAAARRWEPHVLLEVARGCTEVLTGASTCGAVTEWAA